MTICEPTADTDAVLDAGSFRSVFRQHPAGVAVITLSDGNQRVGFTATSVISVSAEPPILAFSIAATSSSWPAVRRADTLAVNFLAADQADISARFATSGIDRFAGVSWYPLPTGEPVIEGVSSWVRAAVTERMTVGASFLVCVRAIQAEQSAAPPLIYHDRRYHRLVDHSTL